MPELIVEIAPGDTDAAPLLRSIFDMVWNAFGWQRALTFDEEDVYIGARG